MNKWRYVESDPNGGHTEITMTEDEIIKLYYPWWSEQLRKQGKNDLISERNCIDDWVVVNWAWKVNE